MSKTFPRNMKTLPPTAVTAQGCYIYDKSGKPYLDGSGGAAVSCLGHGDPDVIAAIKAQAGLICYPMPGTRDGKNGDHVLLAPPFIIEDNQLDELIEKLDTAITATLGQHT